MAYQYTVADAKGSYLKSIAGVCTNSQQFLDWLNEATERLMDAGNWWGTEQLAQFCLYNQCITWPRYVGTVVGVRKCGENVEIRNHWYNIIGPARGCCGSFTNFECVDVLKDVNTSPLFNDITGGNAGKLIRVYAQKRNDLGKVITIFGEDANGQPLQYKDSNNNWQMGLRIILAAPYATTTVYVRRITSVLKEVTQGNVLMYEYDPVTDLLRDIALYEPNETNPRYRRSVWSGLHISGSCRGVDDLPLQKIEALVKLQYFPVANDNDFLLIDNFPALKFMLQCIRHEENGQTAEAGAFEQKAIRQMNLRDRDKMPSQQTAIYVDPVGNTICNPI